MLRIRKLLVFIVLAVLFAAFLAACGDDGERDKVTVGLFPAVSSEAGLLVAVDQGYFEDEGIDVELVPLFGWEERLAGVVSGRVTFAFGDVPSIMLAQEEGSEITIVAVKDAHNRIATVSLKEKGIASPKDYEGRTLGSNPGSFEFDLLPILGRINGFDAETVEIRELDFSVLFASLLSGKIDIITAFYGSGLYTWEQAALRDGKELSVIRWVDHGLDTYGDAIVTSNGLIESDPDLIKRFFRAAIKGFTYGIENPSEVPALVTKSLPELTEEEAAADWEQTIESMLDESTSENGLWWIDHDKMEATRSIVFEALDREPVIPTEDLYTTEYLP